MSTLDQMQAVLDQAPMMRPPCSRMAAAQQAAQPDMFSYMAVSRFGPAVLSSLAEQVRHPVMIFQYTGRHMLCKRTFMA